MPQTLIADYYSAYSGQTSPGQVTVTVSAQPMNDGLTPLCSNGIPSQTVVVPITPIGPSGQYGNLLSGQYAFLFNGTNPQIKGASQRLAAVGSLNFDGQGHVTGVEDVNSGLGSNLAVAVTGQYTLDFGFGTLTLQSSLGVQQFVIFVSPSQFAAGVTKASFFSKDGYVVFGNGSLAKQTLPTEPYRSQSYVLNLSGDFTCKATCTEGVPVFEMGSIDVAPSGTFNSQLDGSVGAYLLPQTELSGDHFGANAPVTGRVTYTLPQGPLFPLHMVEYPIDEGHFFTMSTDSHATTYLLSGVGTQ